MDASLKLTLADGAELTYEIFGLGHLGKGRLPLVLICGMGSQKDDWDRLLAPLSERRTVLTFDHRGMGDPPADRNDEITIEVMARDLLALVEHVGWKDVDILGFSMGGVVLQQLLLLPGNPTEPTPLPFRVHHALLTGTFCASLDGSASVVPLPPSGPLTVEQKKAFARIIVDASLGPKWVALPENQARYEQWIERSIHGRPARTIMKQRKSLGQFDFRERLATIPASVQVLVIHGVEDLLVPFTSGEELVRCVPQARMVEIGTRRGQVPDYNFGHTWYEYFGVDVWIGVIEAFVDDESTDLGNARL